MQFSPFAGAYGFSVEITKFQVSYDTPGVLWIYMADSINCKNYPTICPFHFPSVCQPISVFIRKWIFLQSDGAFALQGQGWAAPTWIVKTGSD